MSEKKELTVTCDRCGNSQAFEIPANSDRYNFWGKVTIQSNLGGAQPREFDLCRDCVSAFWAWRNNNEL